MSLSLNTILAVGVGGFIGAISRVLINSYFTKTFSTTLPFGILFVNLLGSFLIGVLFAIFLHYNVNESIKSFFIAGFLGSLTTYSTFAIESFFLLNSNFLIGITNIALNLFGSIFFAGFGYKLLSYFLK